MADIGVNKGRSEGLTEAVTHKGTTVQGTDTVTVQAGNDVTLKGSTVSGDRVDVTAGGKAEQPLYFYLHVLTAVRTSCYHYSIKLIGYHQEQQRDWPDEAAATLGDERCQLQRLDRKMIGAFGIHGPCLFGQGPFLWTPAVAPAR